MVCDLSRVVRVLEQRILIDTQTWQANMHSSSSKGGAWSVIGSHLTERELSVVIDAWRMSNVSGIQRWPELPPEREPLALRRIRLQSNLRAWQQRREKRNSRSLMAGPSRMVAHPRTQLRLPLPQPTPSILQEWSRHLWCPSPPLPPPLPLSAPPPPSTSPAPPSPSLPPRDAARPRAPADLAPSASADRVQWHGEPAGEVTVPVLPHANPSDATPSPTIDPVVSSPLPLPTPSSAPPTASSGDEGSCCQHVAHIIHFDGIIPQPLRGLLQDDEAPSLITSKFERIWDLVVVEGGSNPLKHVGLKRSREEVEAEHRRLATNYLGYCAESSNRMPCGAIHGGW